MRERLRERTAEGGEKVCPQLRREWGLVMNQGADQETSSINTALELCGVVPHLQVIIIDTMKHVRKEKKTRYSLGDFFCAFYLPALCQAL